MMKDVPGAVEVVSQSGPWIAGGVWSLVVLISTVILKPILAQWLPFLKLRSDNAAALRKEKRSDLDDCRERLDRMTNRLDGIYEVVNNLKVELGGVLSAYRVLEAAEERRDRNSLHLVQARAILSTAFSVAPSTAPKGPGLSSAEEAAGRVERDEP